MKATPNPSPNPSLVLAPPSYGELSKPAAKLLANYTAGVQKLTDDEAKLLGEYRELLAGGMVKVVADILDEGEALDARRRSLNERFSELRQRRFELARDLAPEFARIASDAKAADEQATNDDVTRMRASGMTAMSAAALRGYVVSQPPAAERRARVRLAVNEAETMKLLGGQAGNASATAREHVKWPAASGDAAIVARLLAPVATAAPSPYSHVVKDLQGRPIHVEEPVTSSGARPASWGPQGVFAASE